MKFKFKVQQYQTDAADAVASVFEGQPNQGASVYLRDLGRKPTRAQGEIDFGDESAEGYANAPVALSEELFCGMGACQLDVEMETGTGKTYVYTKTMLELNRLYGWCKFIVVVPSVAIREGVAKSLENTQEHFFSQYHKRIRFFIYDSDNLTELDSYSQSSDVNCMVINMQAFNASMKEGAKNKAARIIFDERDEFGSRRPIDVIAANRPIVICDEPQKMGKKGGATQKGISRFNPLFVLSYSATHKEKHDLVYALDALDAYNQKLVKRIEVKGFALKNMRGTDGYLYLRDIVVSKNRAPEAVIEFKCMGSGGKVRKKTARFGEGDSIYDASGSTKLEAYRGPAPGRTRGLRALPGRLHRGRRAHLHRRGLRRLRRRRHAAHTDSRDDPEPPAEGGGAVPPRHQVPEPFLHRPGLEVPRPLRQRRNSGLRQDLRGGVRGYRLRQWTRRATPSSRRPRRSPSARTASASTTTTRSAPTT